MAAIAPMCRHGRSQRQLPQRRGDTDEFQARVARAAAGSLSFIQQKREEHFLRKGPANSIPPVGVPLRARELPAT